MRVITGSARGIRLLTVPGTEVVRPTSEKIKEALFSSIQFDIEGRRILDLFAGSGQLGIEALSRGAKNATFVDSSDVSINVIKQNLKNTRLEGNARVIKGDFITFCSRCSDKFDIAFLDPPYNAGYLEKALNGVIPLLSDYGKIFCEHPIEINLPETINDFHVCKNYRYGKIAVTVYKKDDTADE
jgi:16S rRNA (guanine(966)-N(2))-methyltransferase RsmD